MATKPKPKKPLPAEAREEMVPISLRVPESMRREWKVAAAQDGMTLTDVIVDQMTRWLQSRKPKK